MKRSCFFVILVGFASQSSGNVLCGGGGRCRRAELAQDQMSLKFRNFMKTYNKIYKDQEEEARRFKIFVENMERVRMLQETEKGSARYGVTKFSDLSADEFMHRSLKPAVVSSCKRVSLGHPSIHLSETMDWRDHNAVTAVRNQKDCKSCWAFAVVGNVESQWFIRKKELIPLAEQELLDCGSPSNSCHGGKIDMAFNDVRKLGLQWENSYPYQGRQMNCRRDSNASTVRIRSCIRLPRNETEMKHYVALNGTIVVLVNLKGLQLYSSGILRSNCSSDITNHAMLIVGYGIDSNMPYWIVKNSWGLKWGEKGYIRIYRGENTCGINKFAMSSVV